MSKWYPRGKLNDSDEGAAFISIAVKDKTVIIDFGKEITWIGFDKDTAIHMAHVLLEKAKGIN
jgi:hypothetical protein